MVIRRWTPVCAGALAVVLSATTVQAQLTPRSLSQPASAETYHFEVAGALWNPNPNFVVASEELGFLGTEIDAVADLGVERRQIPELRVVLRPALKHKFRLDRIPAKYTAASVLTRNIVFNGQAFRLGIPVDSTLNWTTYRLGYEYDFIARDRGFVGLVLEAKYTDVEVELSSPLTVEFARARAPIPAIGGIGRVYVVPNVVSVTFELTGMRLPESVSDRYRFSYFDFDLYGTVNFNRYVGAQVGYRSLDALYRLELDEGSLKLKGFYFGGVVRY
jgi:hypothetical protein